MNPKTLQYLMEHSDIGVTLNTYTHLGLEDATDELKRMEKEVKFDDQDPAYSSLSILWMSA